MQLILFPLDKSTIEQKLAIFLDFLSSEKNTSVGKQASVARERLDLKGLIGAYLGNELLGKAMSKTSLKIVCPSVLE